MGGIFDGIADWFIGLPAWGQALGRVLILVLPILLLVPILIWWERRLLSWMQDRIGPNRVGPFGLLQTICDGVKLFFKEDITPSSVDRFIYIVAPAVALFPAFAIGATLPIAPHIAPWGAESFYRFITPVADVNIGVLYIFAISSLGVYGVVLAGYASNNKYSLMGGLRSSAQLISYELGMGMALAALVLAAGSLRMSDMVRVQEADLWGAVPALQNWFILTPFGFVAGVVFLICMVAETNRAPFDLPEAENELIAGYHTEYSSMKFAVFFMGEYAAMFLFAGIFTALFLGGHNALPLDWYALGLPVVADINYYLAPVIFLGKVFTLFSLYVWIRATLPRLRYDQLMSLGWRSLLPLAVTNFILVGLWILMVDLYGPLAGLGIAVGAGLLLYVFWRVAMNATGDVPGLPRRQVRMVSDARPIESGETIVAGS
ncbi:MAG TPA: NADH-quinone oxidoreductase subunit NuoH [Fimbriimonadaceae bacterium]|nr:NADH-quinone oxidoreductase subunit NuoH [Fimbriimonadaceae bacterium]